MNIKYLMIGEFCVLRILFFKILRFKIKVNFEKCFEILVIIFRLFLNLRLIVVNILWVIMNCFIFDVIIFIMLFVYSI